MPRACILDPTALVIGVPSITEAEIEPSLSACFAAPRHWASAALQTHPLASPGLEPQSQAFVIAFNSFVVVFHRHGAALRRTQALGGAAARR